MAYLALFGLIWPILAHNGPIWPYIGPYTFLTYSAVQYSAVQ